IAEIKGANSEAEKVSNDSWLIFEAGQSETSWTEELACRRNINKSLKYLKDIRIIHHEI
ncbi:MAG: hypothetical protein MHPSP_002888, partial [Paramarteilia canceri]